MFDEDYDRYREELLEEAKAAWPDHFVTHQEGEEAVHSDGVRRDTDQDKTLFTLLFPKGVPMDEQLIVRVAELYTRGGRLHGLRNWENSKAEDTLEHHTEALWRHFPNATDIRASGAHLNPAVTIGLAAIGQF